MIFAVSKLTVALMDLGLEAAAGSAEARPAKARAVGSSNKDNEKLMVLIAKLCLANSLACRVLKSVTLEVVLLKASSGMAVSMLEAGRNFAKAAESLSAKVKFEKLGTPHLHVFNAALKVALEGTDDQAAKKTISDYTTRITAAGTAKYTMMAAEIKHWRINKCFDRELKRLEFNIPESSPAKPVAHVVVAHILSHCGGERKPGMAPPGDLERKIQEAVTELIGGGD